eukprot:4109690-Amphidinium_carterae.1
MAGEHGTVGQSAAERMGHAGNFATGQPIQSCFAGHAKGTFSKEWLSGHQAAPLDSTSQELEEATDEQPP